MDDEVLACGGTIAQLSHRAQVHVVYATDGARSYSPSVPWLDRTSPELGTVRKTEAKAALQVLGVSSANLHFLDFPDGELERHAAAFERSFIELLRRLRPDYVLVPFRYDRHPDHRARHVLQLQDDPVTRHEAVLDEFDCKRVRGFVDLTGADGRVEVPDERSVAEQVDPRSGQIERRAVPRLDVLRELVVQREPRSLIGPSTHHAGVERSLNVALA